MSSHRPERPAAVGQYVWMMRFLAVGFAGLAFVFLFFPNELFYLINVGPKVFNITEAIPEVGPDRFWLVIAVSAVAMDAALCLLAAESPRIHGYALVLILGHIVSASGFAYLFASGPRYFAYALGAVLDFPLAMLILFFHVRARAALGRPPETSDPAV